MKENFTREELAQLLVLVSCERATMLLAMGRDHPMIREVDLLIAKIKRMGGARR